MSMANEKNLRPLNTRSQRERKEIAKMGAKASNRVQKNKKLLKEAAEVLLATSADNNTKVMLRSYKMAANNCTYAMAVVVAQKKAIAGDTKAFIALRDVLGDNSKFTEQEDYKKDKSILCLRAKSLRQNTSKNK